MDWIASEVGQIRGWGGGSRLEVGAALRFELGNDDLLRSFALVRLPVFVWIMWGLPWEVGAAGCFAIMLGNGDSWQFCVLFRVAWVG